MPSEDGIMHIKCEFNTQFKRRNHSSHYKEVTVNHVTTLSLVCFYLVWQLGVSVTKMLLTVTGQLLDSY